MPNENSTCIFSIPHDRRTRQGNTLCRLDIYEKVSLAYRGSWLTPITYPFLPVHRLVLRPIILRSSNLATCVDARCVHGQCTEYMNDLNEAQFLSMPSRMVLDVTAQLQQTRCVHTAPSTLAFRRTIDRCASVLSIDSVIGVYCNIKRARRKATKRAATVANASQRTNSSYPKENSLASVQKVSVEIAVKKRTPESFSHSTMISSSHK